MRIGIYGGSFNPVHYGHVRVARRAIDELRLERLLVIPAAVSPFKAGERLPEFPWERLAMVRNAFADIPEATVDERELRRGGVSYAIDTVRELKAEFGDDAELHFIIGEDSLAGLDRWKDIAELRRLVVFDAFPRTSESSTAIRGLFAAAAVRLNPDSRLVETVRRGLAAKHGFCPCRLAKSAEFFCPCDEFKAQLADPAFRGLCHCRLYLKP